MRRRFAVVGSAVALGLGGLLVHPGEAQAKPKADPQATPVEVRKTPRAGTAKPAGRARKADKRSPGTGKPADTAAVRPASADASPPPLVPDDEPTLGKAGDAPRPAVQALVTLPTGAPTPSDPEAGAAPASPAADKVATPSSQPGPLPPRDTALLAVQAAVGTGTRRFSYVQAVTPTLRPYDLAATPIARVSAEVYPLVWTGTPFVRDFGLTGSYARALALASEDSTGARVGTTWQSFDVGATERFVLTPALLASVSGSYGGDDFKFDQNLAGGAAALPTVAYRFVRFGGDLRGTFLSSFSVFGGASYLDILSTGYSGDLFPKETVGGVEGHVGAAYGFAKHYEVSLGASYSRFFYSFHSVPTDANVAGGALDEQTRVYAAFAYLM
jgi:hypothetical protein